VAALSLLAGVHAARRDGQGMDCDISLFDVALGMLTYPATWHLHGGFRPARTRHSAHPSLVPFQAFRAADGWLVVACPKEKFWRRLAGAIGRPDLASDPRFATFAARRKHAAELLVLLDEAFIGRPAAAWLDALRAAGVPCGPVNTVPQALADPQTVARGMVVPTEHPRFGTVRQVRSPVRVGETAPEYRAAPARNADAAAVLGGLLGYDAARIAELAAAAAFGPAPP
jgi:crotonobetainyl-CoA:carnitine CoA-transferase CaiB-like acyl-CoA transferase